MSQNKVLLKVLDVLCALCEVYNGYLPMSLSTLSERERQAVRITKLEDKMKNYAEESAREIFFLRQSLKELRTQAKMVTVVTKDLFETICKQVAETQQAINIKHHSAITELWRLNNSAAELNQHNKLQLKAYKDKLKRTEITEHEIKRIKHLVAKLSLSRLQLRNTVTDVRDELSSVTKAELDKLQLYLRAYNRNLCKSVFAPEIKRVRVADVNRELSMDDVILLEE